MQKLNIYKKQKKSAFNKLAQQELQLVKTDVDSKAKKKGHKKHDDEDELAKVDRQIVSLEEIRDVELAAETRRHRSFQEGGSSSSKTQPKAKKRDASKSPETLRSADPELAREYKNVLSKIEIKRNEVYERALTTGAKIEHHPTFGAWKMEMGKKKEPLHQQMALGHLSYNSNTTIAAMINKILEFDKK